MNPTKVPDLELHRTEVTAELAKHGWAEPLWLETTVEDGGHGLARRAVDEQVDLVFACGGDGTVRAVIHGLVGSGVPVAVLSVGTGNLLAQNLALGTSLAEGIATGVTGRTRVVDLGVIDGEMFAVMAGIGLDAAMLESTTEKSKSRFGALAYVAGALSRLRDRPIRVTLRLDDGPPFTRRARMVLVGNVGRVQGGLQLFPAAEPDDGRLDVLVLAPYGLRDWLGVAVRLLTRSPREDRRIERFTARTIRMDTTRPMPRQYDGDLIESGVTTRIMVAPKALLIRVPADAAR
ncbi:diacylglycerol/lipid kinase family protein [Nonomuraea zeae]|uniref:diacylglycerol/lipid kinase family protein n=1 Tax=Nonomuraea zeae TaxID=1642303 RepID=UPI001479290A|nr:diacylglycerol kinase family protein [Nonomuraea zeae]